MENLVWRKFNKLVVVQFVEKKWNYIYWECYCECWKRKLASWMSLKNWDTKSCWCAYKNNWAKKTHWMTNTRFYKIYCWIKSRCNNANDTSYRNYWWRWIRSEWISFEDFKQDMYEGYMKHCNELWEIQTTIDRINVNLNYCKENCRWETLKCQSNNKRTTHIVEYNWMSKSMKEWSIELWIPYSIFSYRINTQKMTIDKILLFKDKKYVRL